MPKLVTNSTLNLCTRRGRNCQKPRILNRIFISKITFLKAIVFVITTSTFVMWNKIPIIKPWWTGIRQGSRRKIHLNDLLIRKTMLFKWFFLSQEKNFDIINLIWIDEKLLISPNCRIYHKDYPRWFLCVYLVWRKLIM